MIVWALYIPAGKAITNSFSSWFSSRKAKLVVATSKPQVVHRKNYLKSLLLLSTMYYEAEKSQKNRCSITKNLKTPFSFAAAVSRNHKIITNNLFLKSKNETTNSPIHKFKVLQNVF